MGTIVEAQAAAGRRRGPLLALFATAAVALALLAGACGGSSSPPAPVDDPGSRASGLPLPSWFPAQFPPPPGGVVVEVIDEPMTGPVTIGRSVTWRVDRSYRDVLRDLDNSLASIGWTPTERLSTSGEQDSQRTSIYFENGVVQVIRVYVDANLKGTRVTVELPA